MRDRRNKLAVNDVETKTSLNGYAEVVIPYRGLAPDDICSERGLSFW